MSTTYYVISWVDHDRQHHAANPTREYGTASSKQAAAIRLPNGSCRSTPTTSSPPSTAPSTTAVPHPTNDDTTEPDRARPRTAQGSPIRVVGRWAVRASLWPRDL